ncbi:MAG: GyrI-like domain-containing protein [Eubacteriales bacterium]
MFRGYFDKFDVKHLSPNLTLRLTEPFTFSKMEHAKEQLISIAENNETTAMVSLVNQEKFHRDMEFNICFPVNEADFIQYDQSNFYVLPRVKVVSLSCKGTYTVMEETFQSLQSYFQKHNLKSTLPYRIAYFPNKKFLQKNQAYFTEIQIPIMTEED